MINVEILVISIFLRGFWYNSQNSHKPWFRSKYYWKLWNSLNVRVTHRYYIRTRKAQLGEMKKRKVKRKKGWEIRGEE